MPVLKYNLGPLRVKPDPLSDGTAVHLRALCTHTFTRGGNLAPKILLTGRFWEVAKNGKCRTCINSNTSKPRTLEPRNRNKVHM